MRKREVIQPRYDKKQQPRMTGGRGCCHVIDNRIAKGAVTMDIAALSVGLSQMKISMDT